MIYLNNATTSFPKSEAALQTFDSAIRHPLSDIRHSSAPGIEVARSTIARLLNVLPSHVYFVADATLGLNLVIQGILSTGGLCVSDNRAHNAVSRTLHNLPGVQWQVAEMYDAADEFDERSIDIAINESVDLVCLTHASNVTGSVYPIDIVIDLIRKRAPNANILVDASQSAGVTTLDAVTSADFIVFPGHKHLHALLGAAVVIAKRKLAPAIFGGTGTDSAVLTMAHYPGNIVEVGTPNLPAILALSAAFEDWHQNQSRYAFAVQQTTTSLWSELSKVPGLRLVGRPPGAERTGIVAINVPFGRPEHEWIPFLRAQGIIARGGLHCCPLHHRTLGLESVGTLRLSVSRYTTPEQASAAAVAVADFCHVLSDLQSEMAR